MNNWKVVSTHYGRCYSTAVVSIRITDTLGDDLTTVVDTQHHDLILRRFSGEYERANIRIAYMNVSPPVPLENLQGFDVAMANERGSAIVIVFSHAPAREVVDA